MQAEEHPLFTARIPLHPFQVHPQILSILVDSCNSYPYKYRSWRNGTGWQISLPACLSKSQLKHKLDYGVSTRTMVGLGMLVLPLYATLPRYLVAGASPLKLSVIVPVAPVVADAGAFTVILPAAADPSSQWNKVKVAEPGTPHP